MAKWYDAANEASFKPVVDGHVFQSPNPWIFARPRYYLVNEAQKAEIAVRLRRWRLLTLTTFLAITVLVVAFFLLSPGAFIRQFQPAFFSLGVGFFTLQTFLLIILVFAPFVAVPHIYLIRALRPLLADAPRTNQRIKMREQLPKIAASVSSKVLVVGIIGGLCMICGPILMLLDAFFEGHLARSLPLSSPSLVIGVLLTTYFVYLVKLKAKLKRIAR